MLRVPLGCLHGTRNILTCIVQARTADSERHLACLRLQAKSLIGPAAAADAHWSDGGSGRTCVLEQSGVRLMERGDIPRIVAVHKAAFAGFFPHSVIPFSESIMNASGGIIPALPLSLNRAGR